MEQTKQTYAQEEDKKNSSGLKLNLDSVCQKAKKNYELISPNHPKPFH